MDLVNEYYLPDAPVKVAKVKTTKDGKFYVYRREGAGYWRRADLFGFNSLELAERFIRYRILGGDLETI